MTFLTTVRTKLLTALLLVSAFIFNGCKTDFEVVAPYKEIPVVYGLLNASDSLQYIRIQKAFLGEGNALNMAQNPDSIYYPDILLVKLDEYNSNGAFIRTINLIRDEAPKEPGVFSSATHYLYRTQGEKIFTQYRYQLVITNTVTGKVYTSQTEVVDNLTVLKPTPFPAQINWLGFPYAIEYSPFDEGYLYQLIIRFYYTERNVTTNETKLKYLDWKFPERTRNEPSAFTIGNSEFFIFVASQLDPDPAVKRHAVEFEFFFHVAGKSFSEYMQVNTPPTGVNQEIPLFSNINGGLGIFSSRNVKIVRDKYLHPTSEAELISGPITGNLGFE